MMTCTVLENHINYVIVKILCIEYTSGYNKVVLFNAKYYTVKCMRNKFYIIFLQAGKSLISQKRAMRKFWKLHPKYNYIFKFGPFIQTSVEIFGPLPGDRKSSDRQLNITNSLYLSQSIFSILFIFCSWSNSFIWFLYALSMVLFYFTF